MRQLKVERKICLLLTTKHDKKLGRNYRKYTAIKAVKTGLPGS
jgi:hypothetical protein